MASIYWAFLPLAPLAAARTVTVDDADTSTLIYQPQQCGTGVGSWMIDTDANNPHAIHGTIRYCNVENASVTLHFTGIDVSIMGPLWPYPMSFNVTLDGVPQGAVSVYDTSVNPPVFNGDSTVFSKPVWSKAGLDNTSHTLVIGSGNSMDGFHDLMIDAINYTIPDAVASSTSPSNSSPSAPADSSPSPTSHSAARGSQNSLVIGLSVAVGALVLGGVLFCLWKKRRRLPLRFLGGRDVEQIRQAPRPERAMVSLTASPVTTPGPFTLEEQPRPVASSHAEPREMSWNSGDIQEVPRSTRAYQRDAHHFANASARDSSGLPSSANMSSPRSRLLSATSAFSTPPNSDAWQPTIRGTPATSLSRVDSFPAVSEGSSNPFECLADEDDHPTAAFANPYSNLEDSSPHGSRLHVSERRLVNPTESVVSAALTNPYSASDGSLPRGLKVPLSERHLVNPTEDGSHDTEAPPAYQEIKQGDGTLVRAASKTASPR